MFQAAIYKTNLYCLFHILLYIILTSSVMLTMHFLKPVLLIFTVVPSVRPQDSYQPCPLLGPRFPLPTGLSSSKAVQAALANLTASLDALSIGDSGGFSTTTNTTTFSVGLFSSEPPGTTSSPLFYQYHHTAFNSTGGPVGGQRVHADSVYNIARVTTVFTVYAFLIAAGDTRWLDPITKHVPELAFFDGNQTAKSGDWGEVRLIDLASNMAGIARDGTRIVPLNPLGRRINIYYSRIRHYFRQINSQRSCLDLTHEKSKNQFQVP
jgi:hypothetical protein